MKKKKKHIRVPVDKDLAKEVDSRLVQTSKRSPLEKLETRKEIEAWFANEEYD